jgi:hypothetical protein
VLGVACLVGDQHSLDAIFLSFFSLSVDAGVDCLVLVHAQPQVLQHSFQRLVVDAEAGACESRVDFGLVGECVCE